MNKKCSATHLLVQACVSKYGFFIVPEAQISPKQPELRATYTVGLLKSYNHPELAIFGLTKNASNAILKELIATIQHKIRYTAGMTLLHTESNDLGVRLVEIESKYIDNFEEIKTFYEELSSEIKILQVVWPDEQRKFPWDEGHDVFFDSHQPLWGSPTKILEVENE